VLYRPAGSLS